MAGRLVLNIASQCRAMTSLGDIVEVALRLEESLAAHGEWKSAAATGRPLLDPTLAEMRAAISSAFEAARESDSTLMISFIGHATATAADDFYLLVTDSESQPDSASAFHLLNGLREQLYRGDLEGLVLLIDSCDAPRGLAQLLGRGATTPVEVLQASVEGPAYGPAQFSEALVKIFDEGIPDAGARLTCGDVVAALGPALAPKQIPNYSSYSQMQPTWLVHNQARPGANPVPAHVHPALRSGQMLIPGIAGDETSGPDSLGVDADAAALAALIASTRLVPPLAVAVYGEWGSGKTFFMRRIEANIDRLTARDPGGTVFEPAVRHIRFGAWHYARGNLWASLLEHVFTTLCPPDSTADQMLVELTASIPVIQEALADADQRVDATKLRIDEITAEIGSARERHDDTLESLKSVRARDIWAAITSDGEVSQQFQAVAAELNIPAAINSTRELLGSTRTVIALVSKVKFLATAGKHWYSSPLAAAGFIAVMVGAITTLGAAVSPDTFHTIAALMATLATAGSGAAAWIVRQSTLARGLLGPAERLQCQIEQRVEEERVKQAAELKKLEAQAAVARAELDAAREQKAAAVEDLDAARRTRDELTPARLLEDYIANRAASGEYAEHLGVVGMAHRDLRRLGGHLRDAASDPSVCIKRIVLYIDDLDRCAPNVVVEVLEVVHLLLALPLFVVVVGVDPRSLDRSLRATFPEMLGSGDEAPSSWAYLEKIFQLTYTLQPMTLAGCQTILREVASRGGTHTVTSYPGPESWPSNELFPATDSTDPETSIDDGGSTASVIAAPVSETSADERLAEALILSDNDLATLEVMAPLVATTPRRVKRFLNIYVVVRARLAAEPHNTDALAVLVATLIGTPDSLGRMLRESDRASAAGSFGQWAREAQLNITDAVESARVAAFLDNAGTVLDLSFSTVLDHLSLVRPYVVGGV
ncbi:P-loop NTPase fold protein [Nocardia sp. NBC_00565]|uniref:P-loop NTPase fold protein n=1 Tax=Nocardia sp. NBC_00565 TaxID=2975993 RepID=UPI002E80C891|nr:P-loop NTPase fold protein [Nocardia sp. NBC_00565]WUC06871.1 P-loop NTPase fold protein [Nocardia sp. NBC_00565]